MSTGQKILILAVIALILLCLDLGLYFARADVTVDKKIHVGGGGTLYSSGRADTQTGVTGDRISGRGEQFLESDSAMSEDWSTTNTTYSLLSDSPWFHNTYTAYASTTNKEYSRYISTFGSKTFRVQTTLKANDSELRSYIEASADGGQLTDVAIDNTKKKPIELSRVVVSGPFELGIKFDAFVPTKISADWLPCPSPTMLGNGTAWRPIRINNSTARSIFDVGGAS